MMLIPAAVLALTTRSASVQSKHPLQPPSIARHWKSVFCQWKPASVTSFRSRAVVEGWPHRKRLMPKSGLATATGPALDGAAGAATGAGLVGATGAGGGACTGVCVAKAFEKSVA